MHNRTLRLYSIGSSLDTLLESKGDTAKPVNSYGRT